MQRLISDRSDFWPLRKISLIPRRPTRRWRELIRRSRIDDRHSGNGPTTLKISPKTSFHTASVDSGHYPGVCFRLRFHLGREG
jgi:hypothetical protein